LTSCYFFLFLKTKLQLRGHSVDGVEEIQRESQNALVTLKRPELPARIPTVTMALGLACRCTRGHYPNLNQVHTFWSVGTVWELFDTSTYLNFKTIYIFLRFRYVITVLKCLLFCWRIFPNDRNG
jgi:hypothetical protein